MSRSVDIAQLDLILTARCNLTCRYCYQREKRPLAMSRETLRAALDLALATSRPAVAINFYGGEPLLEWDMIEHTVRYVASRRSLGKLVRFKVITNGTLITPEVTAFLARNNIRLQLSFDGVEAVQDLRAPGSFGELDRLLTLLAAEHPSYYRNSVSVSATLTPGTVMHLGDSFDYFLSKSVCHIDISPVITACSGWSARRVEELEGQFDRVLASSLRHLRETGRVPFLMFRGKRDGSEVRRSRPVCDVAERHALCVDADGQVYGCNMFAQSVQRFRSPLLREALGVLRLGDLRDPGLLETYERFPEAVHELTLFARKDLKYSSYRRCGECEYAAACPICPAATGHIEGNLDPNRVSDFMCAFNYAALSRREQFPEVPTLVERIRRGPVGSDWLQRASDS